MTVQAAARSVFQLPYRHSPSIKTTRIASLEPSLQITMLAYVLNIVYCHLHRVPTDS
jgi:hypothetical protein